MDGVSVCGLPNGCEPGVVWAVRKLHSFSDDDFNTAAEVLIDAKSRIRFPILWHIVPSVLCLSAHDRAPGAPKYASTNKTKPDKNAFWMAQWRYLVTTFEKLVASRELAISG